MKEFLSQRGVTFTLKLVDEDPSAYDELVARGYRRVPLTCVAEAVVVGFDEKQLSALLDGVGR